MRRVVRLAGGAAILGCGAGAAGREPAPALPITAAASACLVADTPAPQPDTLYVIGPASPAPAEDCQGGQIVVAGRPAIVFVDPPAGTDLRDVLDRGLPGQAGRRPDVLVTRDPDVVAYAARGNDYFAVSLPWDRAYVLAGAGPDSTPAPSAGERDALARDAVHGAARGATNPATCRARATQVASTPAAVVAYPAGDEVARALAERVVALSGGQRPAWIAGALSRVAPVPADSVDGMVASGRAALAVLPVARRSPGYCGAALVETHATAIVRRGSGAAFIVGADGGLSFVRLGAKQGAP